MTMSNLSRHELIGLKVNVVHSSNPLHVGIEGVVVDETKNMIVIADYSVHKRIPKKDVIFDFTLSDGLVIPLEGRHLLARPADRVKKRMRRRRS